MTDSSARIYLDHAATSFPKSAEVIRAMTHYLNDLGVAPGRGATRTGEQVDRILLRCRQHAAKLFHTPSPRHVLFTTNGTESLNLAIHGLLNPLEPAKTSAVQQVLTTQWEHNSVLRPLQALQEAGRIKYEIAASTEEGQVCLEDFREKLRARPRLVILNHASNVTGIVQPIAELAALAKEAGSLVLIDAAQTAGLIPISFQSVPADMIAVPGHKGLGGPLGTGLLLITEAIATQLSPVQQGGTGTKSESLNQPLELPERFESGNLNAPGLFGLEAALQQLVHRSPEDWANQREHAQKITQQFIAGAESLPGVFVHFGTSTADRVPVVSLSFAKTSSQVMASILDEHYRIETRAGLHCAPLAHQAMGTDKDGGTLRFSFGPETTSEIIDQTLTALAEISVAL